MCDSEVSHVNVAVWCSCSQLQPSPSALVSQGSYLQRHTSSLILKMSQDTATPPLPAVAHMVRLMPLLLYCQNVLWSCLFMQHILVCHAAMLEIHLMIVACLVYAVLLGLINFIMSSCTCWAAWFNAWLPIELMPNGVVFSFLFFSCTCTASACEISQACQLQVKASCIALTCTSGAKNAYMSVHS